MTERGTGVWVRLGEIKSGKKFELIRLLPPVVPIRLLVRARLYCFASKPLKLLSINRSGNLALI